MIVVIGNGLSRKNFDLNEIKKYAITFGCNALYRDFSPDYLISIDSSITHEIINSDYTLTNNFYLNNISKLPAMVREGLYFDNLIENEPTGFEFIANGYEDKNFITWIKEGSKIYEVPWDDDGYGLSAGICAIRLAHHMFPNEEIYLIGFDIFGDRNNVYDGTNAYPEKNTPNLMVERFISGFKFLFDNYPDINIKRVINQEQTIDKVPNISEEELWQALKDNRKI